MPIWDPAFLSRYYDQLTHQDIDVFMDDAEPVFDVDDLPPCVLSQLEVPHDPESLRSAAPAACAPAGEPVLPELGPGAVDFARVPDPDIYADIAARVFADARSRVSRRNPDTDAYYRPLGI